VGASVDQQAIAVEIAEQVRLLDGLCDIVSGITRS